MNATLADAMRLGLFIQPLKKYGQVHRGGFAVMQWHEDAEKGVEFHGARPDLPMALGLLRLAATVQVTHEKEFPAVRRLALVRSA
jgi:hypothetical protein